MKNNIGKNVVLGKNVHIHPTALIYDNVVLHDNVFIGAYCIIGEPSGGYYDDPENYVIKKTEIGKNSIVRSHSVIYEDVIIGDNFQTGHHVTIREKTKIGTRCSIGTSTDIQDKVEIGNYVRIHSNVFMGQLTTIKDYAWIFPGVIMTNDKYPPMNELVGCTIEEYALVAAGSILLPGINVGKNSLVAAGTIVSKDVLEMTAVRSVLNKTSKSITELVSDEGEKVYPWKDNLKDFRGYPWQISDDEANIREKKKLL